MFTAVAGVRLWAELAVYSLVVPIRTQGTTRYEVSMHPRWHGHGLLPGILTAYLLTACGGLGRLGPGSSHGGYGGPACPPRSFSAGRMSVTQTWIDSEDKCIVMISSREAGTRSRSFVFNSKGMLLTFTAFGRGSVSRTTGARTQFLLPNVRPLRVAQRGRHLDVHTSSGHTVTFDTASGRPTGITGGVLRVANRISPRGGGGVRLELHHGVLVDLGFSRGESPHLQPRRTAMVTDGRGRSCKIRNSELFSYTDGEPRLRFGTTDEIGEFLAAAGTRSGACGALAVGPKRD